MVENILAVCQSAGQHNDYENQPANCYLLDQDPIKTISSSTLLITRRNVSLTRYRLDGLLLIVTGQSVSEFWDFDTVILASILTARCGVDCSSLKIRRYPL